MIPSGTFTVCYGQSPCERQLITEEIRHFPWQIDLGFHLFCRVDMETGVGKWSDRHWAGPTLLMEIQLPRPKVMKAASGEPVFFPMELSKKKNVGKAGAYDGWTINNACVNLVSLRLSISCCFKKMWQELRKTKSTGISPSTPGVLTPWGCTILVGHVFQLFFLGMSRQLK